MREEFGVPVLRPVQRRGFGGHGPPLIVGGTGDRVLQAAAAHADIVSVAGAFQIKGRPPGTMRIGTDTEAQQRVRYARECAGDRAARIEWHALIQAVVQTDYRRSAAAALARRFGNMTPDEILATLFAFIGTVEQMAEQCYAIGSATASPTTPSTVRSWTCSPRSSSACDGKCLTLPSRCANRYGDTAGPAWWRAATILAFDLVTEAGEQALVP